MIWRNLLLSAVSLLLLALPAGIFLLDSNFASSRPGTRNNENSGDLLVVRRVVTPHEIRLSGRLEAVDVIDVSASVSGIVSEVRFKPGDRVRSGTVIAVIRPAGLEERLAVQRERIASAEKDVKARERGAAESEKELAKRREWIRNDLISRNEVLEAEASVETAKAALELARAHLAQQRAIGAQASAAGALGQVRAPRIGQVIRVVAQPGDVVREGSLILSLGDAEALKFVARLHDPRPSGLLVGAEARIGVAAATGSATEVPGTVSRIHPENGGVSVVVIELRTGGQDLRIGTAAEARIDLPPGRDLLAVPRSAIGRQGASAYVYINDGKGVERRTVELGPELGDSIVVYGLSEGDRVYPRAAVESRSLDANR